MLLKNRMLRRENFRCSKETKRCESNKEVVRPSLSIRLETNEAANRVMSRWRHYDSASVNGELSSYLS